MNDFMKAIRILRTSPGFALLAAGTLALGIGLNTALFSVVNGVLLAPLPYPEPDRVVVSVNTVFTDEKRSVSRLTGGDLLDIYTEPDLFQSIGLYFGGRVGLQMRDRAEFAGVAFVSAGYFPVFKLSPLAGRFFVEEDRTGAVVSNGFAIRNFGSITAALGQSVSVENVNYQIDGVIKGTLDLPKNTEVWVQMNSKPENTNRNSYNYRAVARLADGLGIEQANAKLAALGSRLAVVDPGDNGHKSFAVVPLRDQMTGGVKTTLSILMSAVALVLLIACVNVANLLLARATGRSREMAVRSALGASRGRVIRQLLTENLVLALLGAAGGMVLAYWGVDLLLQLAPDDLPRATNIGVSPVVLGFAVLVAVGAALISGLSPAFELSRVDLIESLKQGARGSTSGGSANRMRYTLVVAEIALSVMLAVGSGLLFRTFLSLNAVELGFAKEQVLVVYAHAPAKGLQEAVKATQMFRDMLPKLEVLPGVQRVGAAMGMPAGQYSSDGMYEVEGQPKVADWRQGPQAMFRLSSPNYFATLGIPLLRGRDFSIRDSYESQFVAIVSQSLVKRSFPNQDPIGKLIRCGLDSPNWMTIVGVVGDIRSLSPDKSAGAELYMPLEQHPFRANELQIAMRIAPGVKPESLTEAVRTKMREENPSIAVRFTTLDAMLSGSIGGQRFRAFLLTAFAGVALMLAMAGVYSVMSYVTTQRMNEMGLRMALGASAGNLLGLILGRVMWLGLIGLAIGLTGAAAASRALEGMLYGLKPIDPGTYALVAAVVLGVTALAALGPAWKATRVDPVDALRQE